MNNITPFPLNRVDYRPRIYTEMRLYRFDKPMCDQPYVHTPFQVALLNPILVFGALFMLGWMAKG